LDVNSVESSSTERGQILLIFVSSVSIKMSNVLFESTDNRFSQPPILNDRHRQRSTLKSAFTLNSDPAEIAPLIANLRQKLRRVPTCDERSQIAIAIALEEAISNALFHGNLEVSSELRENGGREFYQLARKRRHEAPFRDRRINVAAWVNRNEASFVVRDEGPGFESRNLPDTDSSEALTRPSGRGVMMMRYWMDEVTFNPKGNAVRMKKRFGSER